MPHHRHHAPQLQMDPGMPPEYAHAVWTALTSERDPRRLHAFGDRMREMNMPRAAAALYARAARLEGRHHGGGMHHHGHPGYGMGQAPPPPRMNTWRRWQAVHPGTSHEDYRNWVTQYGQYGAAIR